MNPRLEHVDVQWTVVALSPSRDLFSTARNHVRANNWSIQSLSVTDMSGDDVTQSGEWPKTTRGAMEITSESERSFFWNADTTPYGTFVTGGLYIGQYTSALSNPNGYLLAMATLSALFWDEKSICIALALEDDFGVDVGPGIIGQYRRDIWRAMALKPEQLLGLDLSFEDPRWIKVIPAALKATPYLSLCDMPEPTRASVLTIEDRLVNYLSGLKK